MTTHSPDLTSAFAGTTLDVAILSAMRDVPSVKSVSVTDRPSGSLVYVALNDLANEATAYEKLAIAQNEVGSIPIKLITVSSDEWDRLTFSENARFYSF